MGGSLSLDKSYGNIFIQTTRNMYTAGDQVDGFIHLNLMRDFPSNVLHLIISGEEDVKLVKTTQEKDSEDKFQTIVHVHKDRNEFYGHTFPLYSNTGSYFLRGQYSFPFSFKLLDTLPGTFRKGWTEHGHDCHAEVSYKLWAGLKHGSKNKGLYDRFTLRVDQRYEDSSVNQSRSFQKKIQAYCYRDIGEFGLQCIFQHNSYRVNDTANILIAVDNTKGQVDVKSIECILWQDTYVKTTDGRCTASITRSLSEISLPGVPAGQSRMGNECLPLMLPIRTSSDLEATCTGTLIQNSFRLEVKSVLDACLCCDQNPSNQISVKIFNKDNVPVPHMMPLQDWSPQVMNPYVCTMTSEYRMTHEFKNNLNFNATMMYPTL